MKFKDYKIHIVGVPKHEFGGTYYIFLQLFTDNGIVGVGEAYGGSFRPRAMRAMISDVVERHVIGQDVFGAEKRMRQIYGRGYTGRPDVSLQAVMSAIDIATWDILGKALNQPVYNLLGGLVNEKLRSYTYIYPDYNQGHDSSIYWNPDLSAERAAHYVKQGFTAIKFDPAAPYGAFDPRMPSLETIALAGEFCKKIRQAVGGKADLLFGTHGQFTAAGAIRFARAIEPFDPLWFEEPTPPEMPEEMAKVAQNTKIPVATGERLTMPYEFQRVLSNGAAAILQPELGRCGGITQGKKIANLAEVYYAQLAPHLYCGPVVAMANIHLAATIPNFLLLESIRTFDGIFADLLSKPITWQDGYVIPSKEPGLGADLNVQLCQELAFDESSDRLHLETSDRPLGVDEIKNHFTGDKRA